MTEGGFGHMRFLKRILALAIGTTAAVSIAMLGSGSDRQSQTAEPQTPAVTISALSAGIQVQTTEPRVGNIASAPKSPIQLGKAEKVDYQWFACEKPVTRASSQLDPSCSEIAGATAAEVTLSNAEVGKRVLFSMSVGNGPVAFSAATEAAVSPAPTLAATPTGLNKSLRFTAATTPALNSKVTVTRGLWPAAGTGYVVSYEWLRCTDVVAATLTAPENCALIPGAVAASYTVTAADVGSRIVSHVTATLAGVTSEIWTNSIGPVYKAVKYYKGATVAAGQETYPYLVGSAVTANEGTWDGPPNFTYQWYSCTKKVAAAATLNLACKAIVGATRDAFTPTLAQNGKYLMVRVSGSTPLATTVVTTFSAGSTKVLDDPNNTKVVGLPSALPIVGNAITAAAGTWTGSPAPVRTYQWYVCETVEEAAGADKPDDCDAIAGATAISYTPVQAHYTKFLLVEEIATSLAGSNSIFSATTAQVLSRPVYESDPIVLGVAQLGEVLSATAGTGASSLEDSVEYQWTSCATASAATSTKPANCSPISGEKGSEYTTTRAVEGLYIAVQVTLKNAAGSTVRMSATTAGFVKATPGLDSVELAPSTDPLVGTAISAPSGIWRGAPTPALAYQWLTCVDEGSMVLFLPAACSEIVGATSPSFTPTHAQAANFLRVRITATNELGTYQVWSGTSTVVKEKPNFIGSPVLSPTALAGTPITVSETIANGVPVPNRAITWYQCKNQVLANATSVPTAGSCTLIAGQSGASYTPNTGDLDKFIGAFVSQSNTLGTASVFTATTTAIRGTPKLVNITIAAPGVAGVSPKVGTALNAPTATWVGSPAPIKVYQWYSCAEEIPASSPDISDVCAEIPGETAAAFTPTVQEVDRYVLVRVGATNNLGAAFMFSPTTSIVLETPNFTSDPTIAGGKLTGESLTFDMLFTRGSPAPDIAYSWYRCATPITVVQSTTTCEKIAGATRDTYTMVAADLDKYVSGAVTLSSSLGAVTKITVSSAKIQGAPAIVGTLGAPTTAAVRADVVINMVANAWTGSPAVTKTYQWFACPNAIAAPSNTIDPNCAPISGATNLTFTPSTAQVGKFLSVRTIASNTLGTETIYSPTTSVVNEVPSFQGEPTIDDLNLVGNKLTATLPATRGFPAPAATYVWYRCSAAVSFPASTAPATCTLISGATANKYELDTPDLDKFVLAGVTLTNSSGTVTRFTSSSVSIQGLPKLSNVLGLPSSSIQGVLSPRIGTLQNAPTNVWTGSPKPTVALQWVRCQDIDTSSSSVIVPCDDIPGATSATYTPVVADKGFALRVRITATSSLGTTTIWSGTTQRTQQPPSFGAEPTLNEFIAVGSLLRVNAVNQVAFPIASESYLWFRCTAPVPAPTATKPTGCTQILNESISTHTILPTDVDNYLVAQVTLNNDAGVATRFTASTAKIISPPQFEQEPTVVGQSYVSGTLTLGPFTVSAKPAATVTYQWYYCTTQTLVSVSEAPAETCFTIAGATAQTYNPNEGDVGKFISVLVTAKNIAGEVTSFSKTSTRILMPPKNLIAPVVSGGTVVGEVLTSDSGTWTPSFGVTFDYKWYACSKATVASDAISSTDCSLVTGATTSRFTTAVEQVGKFMVAAVTAKNFTVPVIKYSASSEIIASVPVYTSGMNVTLPAGQGSTSGAPRVGYKIAAVDGIWSSVPAPSFTYQWFVCATAAKTFADKSLGADCRDINGATSKEFDITKELNIDYNLVGKYLGVKVTGTNKAGSDFAYSVTAAKTVTMPPQLVTEPEISGYRYVDGVLTGTIGTFSGTQPMTVTQAWWQCDAAIELATTVQPVGCTKLVPTTATIKLTLAMKGKFVTTASIGTNDAGTLTVWAPSTVPVTTGAINTVPPTITVNPAGQPKVGATLTANHGTWSGDPALTEESYTYQWYSCAVEIKAASYNLDQSAECIRVGDAVNTTYQPVRDDAGRFILVSVTGTNSQGGSRIFSPSTTKVNLAPELVISPLQSGTAFVGTRQSVSTGTWFGVPDPTFTYQWLLCDSEQLVPPQQKPADCATLTGATADVYSPLIGQVGKFLMVQVTATNIAGSTVAYSLTSVDIKSAPVNLTAPSIAVSNGTTGLPVALQSTLSTSGGTWQGRPAPELQFEWFSCAEPLTASKDEPAETADCKSVAPMSRTSTYDPVASDRGRYLAVKVFATNIHATVTHWSATTTVINMAPVADVAPSVSGVAFSQSIVSAKGDTWTSYPEPTKTYQWLWCGELEIASSCTAITGAAASTYAIPAANTWLGRSLMVKVTATNKFGTASNYSIASAKITSGPVSTSAHVITGSIAYPPAAGAVLSTNDGTWAGDPRPTLTYQWYRCSILIATSTFELDPKCSAIEGATSNTYALVDSDPGNSLVVAITGQNSWGTSTRFSASTPIVTEKVRVLTLPSLLGKAKIDELITGDEGVWRGYPTPTTTYQWYRCLSANPAAPVIIPANSGAGVTPTGCTKITNATKLTYLVSASDKNFMLVFLVTKSNVVDGVTTTINAYSTSSLPASQAPVLLAKPTITSPGVNNGTNPKVGSVWTISDGVWATEPVASQSYQWYRCDSRVATGPTPITTLPDNGCALIPGATAKSYTITAEDSGKFISVESVAVNAADTLHQWSNSTLSVLQVPIAITPPTVSGERQRGKTLTADPGIWTGSPTPTIAFQWYSCAQPIATTSVTPPPLTNNCSQLPETTATYLQTPSDDGRFITVTVSGTSGTADPTVYWVKVSADDATAKAPTARALPRIYPKSGTAAVGEIFSVEDFVWDSAPAPRNTFAWYACDTANIAAGANLPAGCVAIAGQTAQTYTATIELADSRKYLMASVTATNIAGSVTTYSQSYSSIIDKGVNNTKPASITATSLVVPTSVSWTTGEWSSNNQLRVTHKWLYCSTSLTTVYSYIPLECEIFSNIDPLVPATTGPLSITPADEISGQYVSLYEKVEQFVDGKWQKVRERLTPTTGQLLEAPSLRTNDPGFVAPKVDQDMVVGYSTTASPGAWVAAINGETAYTWRGSLVGTFTYQWFSCSAKQASYTTAGLPAGCSYITTSVGRPTTNAAITPLESEIGSFLGVRITATNATGSSVAWTNTSLAVTQEVANINVPTLGTANIVGDRLTLTGGLPTDWKGIPTPALTVEWYSCASPYSVAPTTKPQDCNIFVNGTSAPNEGITIPVERSLNTQYLMVRVTGVNTPWVSANKSSTVSLFSATSKRIISRPYINGVLIPTLSGNADVGSTLNITSGNWLGTLPISWSGRWFACDTPVAASTDANVAAGCTLFKSDTQNVTLTHAQVGKYIVGQMVATNVAGVTYQSAAASKKTLEPPTIITPPEVTLVDAPAASGKIEAGQRLTYTAASWDGAPTPTASGSFYQCTSPVATALTSIPAGCTLVSGVAGSVLTLGDAQAGAYIVAVSTANNVVNGGSRTAYSVSASLGPVYRNPYFDTATAPSISVTPVHAGSTATFTKASVKGFETPTTTYAWYICNSAVTTAVNNSVPAGCSIISNADNAPLTIPSSAAGKYILAVQTASATWTNVTATRSTVTTAIVTASPLPVTPPNTSGDDYVGGPNKLVVDKGVWSSYPAITDNSKYSISWYQCDSPNVAGNTPTGCGAALLTYTANAPQTYAPTSASAGKYLVAKVVATAATNKSLTDSVTYYTSSVGPIREAASLPGQPTIVGSSTPDVGATLSMTTTIPKGFPVNTPSYDWYVCTNTATGVPTSVPADCELQVDYSSKAFPLTAAAAGKYVLGWVTASNSLGSASKATVFTNIVKMAAVNVTLPSLGAGDEVGTAITANPGTWTSTPAPTFAYQWYSCNTATSTVSSGCTAIGASSQVSSFTPTEAQAGKYILANVTATTAIWSGSVLAVKPTATVGPIRMPATVKTTPAITGTAHVGETLVLSFGAGAIVGYPAPDYSYEWYACDSAVSTSAAAIPAGCSNISGWTSKPLIVDASSAGKYIIAAVTASNYSTTLRTTISSAAVTASLNNVTAPVLSGDLFVGGTAVSASPGTWTSTPAVNPSNDVTYSFFTCTTSTWNLACTAISTANAKVSTVTLSSAMQGKYVIARVTATVQVNKVGTGTATLSTNAIGPVEAAPSFTATPTVTGTLHVGSELSAVSSGELGVPAPDRTYNWFFCTSAVAASSATMPAGCTAADASINGTDKLTLPAEAGGKFVSVLVTIKNSRGEVAANTVAAVAVTATPAYTVAPVIGGDDYFATGKNITVTTGTWVTAPTNATKTFTYSWYACPTAASAIANCAYLGDTNVGTLATTEAMVDKFVIAKVTVSVTVNKAGAGTAFAYSNASSRIRKAAVFTATPSVTGNMHIGETLTAGTGSPTGVPAPSVTYTWYICTSPVSATVTSPPTGCVADASSTTSTFNIPATAAGSYVLVIAKASSDSDLTAAYRSSVSTLAVSSPAVLGSPAPVITGTAVLNSAALSVSTGTWTWKPTAAVGTYSYKWFACPSTVTSFVGGTTMPGGCAQIPSQTGKTLTLTAAELGFRILSEVTVSVATNLPNGSKSVYYTAVTDVVMSKPAPAATAPSIGYTSTAVGSVLTAKLGTWTGSPAPTLSYTWYKCPANTAQPTTKLAPATCTALTIKGDLTIIADYKGSMILLQVLAQNGAGTATNISTLLAIK